MMKKMMHILVLSIIILSITSCKKEYVCTCAMPNDDENTYQRDFLAKAYKKEKTRGKCAIQEDLSSTPNTICTIQ